jgi:hypothetical protein
MTTELDPLSLVANGLRRGLLEDKVGTNLNPTTNFQLVLRFQTKGPILPRSCLDILKTKVLKLPTRNCRLGNYNVTLYTLPGVSLSTRHYYFKTTTLLAKGKGRKR